MKRIFWTQEEMDILDRHYPHIHAGKVADMLGCDIIQVYLQALHMGLKKVARKGANGRWLKGSVPHNKGKKMKPEVYEKVKKTMFQKGCIPTNTTYDGYERTTKDGYIEVRIRMGKYRLKHLVEWEKLNGKLPKGHCLACTDGNKQNTAPENWELITRADNMRRNTIQRFPPELRDTIKLLHKLKRKIYEKQD